MGNLATVCALLATRPSLVFQHVAVIDVRTGEIRNDQSVEISGNKIVEVEPTKTFHFPKGTRIVNARGKFMIPGLWDAHMHNDSVANTRDFFYPLCIANGVTGVRNMDGDVYPAGDVKNGVPIEALRDIQRAVSEGKAVGPRAVLGSVIVDGASSYTGIIHATNADEGRKAVEYVRGRGSDFIKVYSSLNRETYFAIADQCKRDGYVFAGHVPESVTAAEASDAGQRSFEHLIRVVEACCTPRSTPERNPQALYMKPSDEKLRLANSYDPKLAKELFAKLRANHTWQCPTTVILASSAFRNRPWMFRDPRVQYLPRSVVSDWDPKREWMNLHYKPKDWHAARALYALEMRVIGGMAKAGVPILAGTDEPGPFCFPGFGLQDELQLLVKAGLTNLRALQSATIEPAKYLRAQDTMGTVEIGKLADLVLLDANPLRDIRNTKKIAGVIANGRYFSRSHLRSLLALVKERARKRHA